MKSGYESLSWINDENGREFVCSLDNSPNGKTFEQLSDEEKAKCTDVNQIVGTERW